MVGRKRRRAGDGVAQGIAAQCFPEPTQQRRPAACHPPLCLHGLEPAGAQLPRGLADARHRNAVAARCAFPHRTLPYPGVVVHGRLLRGRGGAGAIDGDVELAPMAPLPHHRRPAVRADDPMRPTSVFGGCGVVAGHGTPGGVVSMSKQPDDVDTEYVIRRGGELRSMAHIRQGAANAAEKIALLAVEVADDLDRYADRDDALTLHAVALVALARAYIALAAALGEPYVIRGEPRNGAVL